MASGHASRINRPNTWLLRPTCDAKKVLANTEPSTHGTSETSPTEVRDVRSREAIGLLHRGSPVAFGRVPIRRCVQLRFQVLRARGHVPIANSLGPRSSPGSCGGAEMWRTYRVSQDVSLRILVLNSRQRLSPHRHAPSYTDPPGGCSIAGLSAAC